MIIICATCKCKELFESPPTQLTVHQAAGAAVNAAAAVHVAKASHARYLGHTWTAKQAVAMPFDMYRRSMWGCGGMPA
jgi:hypothetical protein